MSGTVLTDAARSLAELEAKLNDHERAAKAKSARLRDEIKGCREVLAQAEAGLDPEKIALARTVLTVGDPAKGGAEWASCVEAARADLAEGGGALWHTRRSTKNYDRFIGQREDHRYGYGPRHGYICFAIGLTSEALMRKPRLLSAEEIEAAIYLLCNLERVQEAEVTP